LTLEHANFILESSNLSNGMRLSAVQEDYIKIIWNLEQSHQIPRPISVAEILKVKSPTVLSMFKQLERLDLISYNKKDGALLTPKGKTRAEKLVRKHRLLESFLDKVLEIGDPVLHDEAEKLEHVISDELTMYIDRYLGFPKIDPHGEIIPQMVGNDKLIKLSDLESNIEFQISLIPMNGNYGKFCLQNEMIPGSQWIISNFGPGRESYLISNENKYLSISKDFAEKVEVTVLKKDAIA
jgi:DtxR family transcriptional regulator, Mn-dependent transcriptional regulator